MRGCLDHTCKRGGVPGLCVMFARDTCMFLANPTSTRLCLSSQPCLNRVLAPLVPVQSFHLLVTQDSALWHPTPWTANMACKLS